MALLTARTAQSGPNRGNLFSSLFHILGYQESEDGMFIDDTPLFFSLVTWWIIEDLLCVSFLEGGEGSTYGRNIALE